MEMLRSLLLGLVASALAADWSFKDFLVGEWDLEKHDKGMQQLEHFSFQASAHP